MPKKKHQNIDDLRVMGRRSQEQVDLIKRVFAGMELIDAKANMYLHAIDKDQIGAIPHDIGNCVFAKTCGRMFGSTRMVFLKRTAYIDMLCEDNIWRVLRFEMSAKIHRSVSQYDVSNGRVFHPGTYLLLAPSQSSTLDARRTTSAARRKNPVTREKIRISARKTYRRRAQIKMTGRIRTSKDARPLNVIVPRRGNTIGIVRSGTGLVQTKIVAS